MSGVRKTTGELAIMRADEFGVTTMEITAHQGARPSHAAWQGKIVDRSGQDSRFLTLDDIGYGTGDGFQGWNCRHDWAPFMPGISPRTWTDEQLKNIDPPPFEHNGKIYSHYDATQKQRRMETAMRKTRREMIGYDAAGAKDYFTASSIKLRRQKEEYAAFSKAAGLRTKPERAGVLGYGHSISSKSDWAIRKNTFANAGGEIIIKVTRAGAHSLSSSIAQVTRKNGGIDRYYYDAGGRWIKQVTNNDHGNPKMHPFGKNGEHAHDIQWDGGKIINREPARELSPDERLNNGDILL